MGTRDVISNTFHGPTQINQGDIITNIFLRKLLPTVDEAIRDSYADWPNARCNPGTRNALLQQVKEWADNPDSECIFWLNSMAGTGKSTISHTVTQSFADERVLGASFFKREARATMVTDAYFSPQLRHNLCPMSVIWNHMSEIL